MKNTKKERKWIQINGQRFLADTKFIPLLKALNKLGLKTTAHCIGHNPGDPKRLSIEISKDTVVAIRNESKPRLIIQWGTKLL